MAAQPNAPTGNYVAGVRFNSEKKLGILHYTSPVDFGWAGDIRKRYTDFIVHEVQRDGTIVRLTDFEEAAKEPEKPKPVAADPPPKPKAPELPPVSETDGALLQDLLGATAATALQEAYATMASGQAVPKTPIALGTITDRSQRGRVHQEIRRIFSGRFETGTDASNGSITALPAATRSRQRNSRRNAGPRNSVEGTEGKGKYLHFTLYKENKDTMEAISHLSRLLKMKPNRFGFAGTKDRRAATTQRVSVKYDGPVNPAFINSRNNNIKIGGLKRIDAPIQLGQHGGNEFTISIKNVELLRGQNAPIDYRLRMTEACVQASLDHIQQHGFINYFGLQRFGTHAIGTQEIGTRILCGDFETACNQLLYVNPTLAARLEDPDVESTFMRDEIARARVISVFKAGDDVSSALYTMPKRFSAEMAIIEHLTKRANSSRDFCGAILSVTRNLRNLYIHAYQSLVWNSATSRRWAAYGSKVVAGDLVLVQSEADPAGQSQDVSENLGQEDDQLFQEARALSAEEAASGKYTIFDIVLPAPGYDVLYPENEIGQYYVEFMGKPENGGLDPYNMRRQQQDFSLKGYYRKIVARFTTVPKFYVRPYVDDSDQMHPTDLDEILARKTGGTQKQVPMRPPSSGHHDEATARRRGLTPDSTQDQPEAKRAKRDEDGAAETTPAPPVAEPVAEPTSTLADVPMPDGQATEDGVAVSESAHLDIHKLPSMEEIIKLFDASGFIRVPSEHLQVSEGNGSRKAINLTDMWRTAMSADAVDANMKIAVVLNFRLETSNYATVCMREMMGAATFVPAEAVSAQSVPEQEGRALLGHGGHVHQEPSRAASGSGV